jgi:conserved oligomeric Golgi complex subunit 6
MQAQIAAMRAKCNEAEAELTATSADCVSLLERAENLRQQRLDIGRKQSLVLLFLSRFTLTDTEVAALSSRDVPIGPQFFAALDRVTRIRADCRVLMAGEEGPTQAGLDVMATTARQLEDGYEKMARWCANEFRQMGRDANLEVSEILQQAIRRLRQRPELLA